MKKGLFWSLLTVFTVSLGFGFSAPTAAGDTINLRMSSFTPPMHFMNKRILEPWIQKLDEKPEAYFL